MGNYMKKISYLSVSLLILLATFAISNISNAQTITETVPTSAVSNQVNSGPGVNAPQLREKIRADLDNRLQNAKTNQEVRNQMIESGYKIASTSQKFPPQRIPAKIDKLASSSLPNQRIQNIKERIEDRREDRQEDRREDRQEDRRENREKAREMALDMLKDRKDSAFKNLSVALRNLSELRNRVGSRIEKDRNSSKDMSKVNSALKIADEKLAIAKIAVEAVKNYKPENSAVTSTSTPNCTNDNCPSPCPKDKIVSQGSTTLEKNCFIPQRVVNLGPIRGLIEKAQNSLKDAHKALNDVVIEIAKISGNRQERTERNGSTTNPTPTSLQN